MLRSPLLSLNRIHSLPVDYGSWRTFAQGCWEDPIIRDAIYLASADFYDQFDRFIQSDQAESDGRSVLDTFIRYYLRMTTRCTPFGFFAGYCSGRIQNQTSILLSEASSYHPRVGIDMEYLGRLARHLSDLPEMREGVRYYPNTSLYKTGPHWKYIEETNEKQGEKTYTIQKIEGDEVLNELIAFTQPGKKFTDIVRFLTKKGWEQEAVESFVSSLISALVLVNDLQVVISGKEYQDYLLSESLRMAPDHDLVRALKAIIDWCDEKKVPGGLVDERKGLLNIVSRLGIPFQENRLVKAELEFAASDNTFDESLANQVLLGIRIRRALSDNRPKDPLKKFREAFSRRFGDREVSLMLALDSETGIGLDGSELHYEQDPIPWLDDLEMPKSKEQAGINKLPGMQDQVKWPTNEKEWYVELDRQSIRALNVHEGEWPERLFAVVEVAGHEPGEAPCVGILASENGSPVHLISRFAFRTPNGSDETHLFFNELIDEEMASHPQEILAEVIHLPEDRTGNILQHPHTYPFEIPFLAQSLLARKQQLLVDDLRLSLKNDQWILRSDSLNQPVIPRLSNAHHFMAESNLPVYRFLCMLQHQHDPGYFSDAFTMHSRGELFQPGLRYKNLIIRYPLWKIQTESISSDTNQFGLPEKSYLIDGDQEIMIDWSNHPVVEAVLDRYRKEAYLLFRPFPFSNGSVVKRGEQSMANQIILTYRKS